MSFSSSLSSADLENSYVSDTLDEFSRQALEFTAYDVTRHIRSQVGPFVEVLHYLVRDIVHKLMAVRTHYNYELFNKNYGGQDVMAYRPSANSTSPQNPITPLGVGSLGVQKNDLVMKPRSEGRVTVPASELKKIGLKPFNSISLHKTGKVISVSKVDGHNPGSIYKLDKYGALRLRRNLVSGYKAFRVKTLSDRVELVGE